MFAAWLRSAVECARLVGELAGEGLAAMLGVEPIRPAVVDPE